MSDKSVGRIAEVQPILPSEIHIGPGSPRRMSLYRGMVRTAAEPQGTKCFGRVCSTVHDLGER